MSPNDSDPPPGTAGGLGLRGRPATGEPARPMRVLACHPRGGTLARCAGTDGTVETVETVLLGRLAPGAVVLVQNRIALTQLDLEWAP